MNLKELFTKKEDAQPKPVDIETTDFTDGFHTYKEHARRNCLKTRGAISALKVGLQVVFEGERRDQVNREYRIKEEIDSLEKKIEVCDTEKDHCDENIANIREKQEQHRAEIESKKETITDIHRYPENHNLEEGAGKSLQRWMLTIVLSLLTVYLFNFYGSASFMSFFKEFDPKELKGKIPSIFDGKAFIEAWNMDVFTFTYILLFAVVFIALGFVVENFRKKKQYITAASFYVITFFFDSLMAYEVTKKVLEIHKKGNLDLTDKMVSFWEPFQDSHFWLILCSGFLVYIIWAFLWEQVLELWAHRNKKQYLIETYEHQIKDLKKKIEELDGEIAKLITKKQELAKDRLTFQASIRKLQMGNTEDLVIYYNKTTIHKCMHEYYLGWIEVLRYTFHLVDLREHDAAADEIFIKNLGEEYSLKNKPLEI